MEDSLTIQLTETEKVELETLEGIIQRGKESFMEVGNALLVIRNSELYREKYKTFNAYCTEKWGFPRDHAGRLIRGSQAAANLTLPRGSVYTPCEIQPTSEYQLRPLTQLEPAQQCEVWEEAVRSANGKTITYKQVKALVDELVGPAAPPPPKKKDPYPHSDAHTFVSMAIITLGRIRDDDPLRVEAVGRVSEWIQEKLTIWTKGE